jgi:hypothetical protein
MDAMSIEERASAQSRNSVKRHPRRFAPTKRVVLASTSSSKEGNLN